jgi:hypothetical protein
VVVGKSTAVAGRKMSLLEFQSELSTRREDMVRRPEVLSHRSISCGNPAHICASACILCTPAGLDHTGKDGAPGVARASRYAVMRRARGGRGGLVDGGAWRAGEGVCQPRPGLTCGDATPFEEDVTDP